MGNKRISDLPLATELSGNDSTLVVQGFQTRKTTLDTASSTSQELLQVVDENEPGTKGLATPSDKAVLDKLQLKPAEQHNTLAANEHGVFQPTISVHNAFNPINSYTVSMEQLPFVYEAAGSVEVPLNGKTYILEIVDDTNITAIGVPTLPKLGFAVLYAVNNSGTIPLVGIDSDFDIVNSLDYFDSTVSVIKYIFNTTLTSNVIIRSEPVLI